VINPTFFPFIVDVGLNHSHLKPNNLPPSEFPHPIVDPGELERNNAVNAPRPQEMETPLPTQNLIIEHSFHSWWM
jgi:hypothetical protein